MYLLLISAAYFLYHYQKRNNHKGTHISIYTILGASDGRHSGKERLKANSSNSSIQWLTDAGLLHKVHNVSKSALPLVSYQELSNFKLYHNDVGLLGAMSELNQMTIVDDNAVFVEFKGSLSENYVFQQLLQSGSFSIFYHTFEKSKYEFDFLVQTKDNEVIPIEVKAGENAAAASFKLFCQRNKSKTAIKTSLSNYKQESWTTNLPLYAINSLTNKKKINTD